MARRTFRVNMVDYVTRYTTYLVEADSFDEAKDRVFDGYGQHIDTDYGDDIHDEEIDTVICVECGHSERRCRCGEDPLVALGL